MLASTLQGNCVSTPDPRPLSLVESGSGKSPESLFPGRPMRMPRSMSPQPQPPAPVAMVMVGPGATSRGHLLRTRLVPGILRGVTCRMRR